MLTQLEIINFLTSKFESFKPEEFTTPTFKISFWGLTLFVKKEDPFIKKYLLFGSIPIFKIYKSKGNRTYFDFFGHKLGVRNNRFSKAEIAQISSQMPKLRENLGFKNVKSIDETIEELINSNKSISRFGDGEFSLIFGESIGYQTFHPKLKRKMKEILRYENQDLMVAIPDIWGGATMQFWKKYVAYNKELLVPLLKNSVQYYSSLVSRINSKDRFEKFKKIWQGKDIVFVEGKASRLGVGNDLFSGARSIKRILCPAKDAFDKYDEIFEACKTVSKDKLFILALGPTATVLAYDLAKEGYRALDLGHIDIEYEWFLMGATKKVPIKNKYVNETKKGKVITEFNDEKYLSEIYKDLS